MTKSFERLLFFGFLLFCTTVNAQSDPNVKRHEVKALTSNLVSITDLYLETDSFRLDYECDTVLNGAPLLRCLYFKVRSKAEYQALFSAKSTSFGAGWSDVNDQYGRLATEHMLMNGTLTLQIDQVLYEITFLSKSNITGDRYQEHLFIMVEESGGIWKFTDQLPKGYEALLQLLRTIPNEEIQTLFKQYYELRNSYDAYEKGAYLSQCSDGILIDLTKITKRLKYVKALN